jgi:hypothetical protein
MSASENHSQTANPYVLGCAAASSPYICDFDEYALISILVPSHDIDPSSEDSSSGQFIRVPSILMPPLGAVCETVVIASADWAGPILPWVMAIAATAALAGACRVARTATAVPGFNGGSRSPHR